MHSFARIRGGNIALAQLFSKESEGQAPGSGRPLEAFVPPQAWKQLTREDQEGEVTIVLTGSFEPPCEGAGGTLQLLAFDGQSGEPKAIVEAAVDSEAAGKGVLEAFEALCAQVDGDVGHVEDIRDLGWDALESVLYAERCALHDPHRGGPHDRLAALTHLGRAVEDAPASRFPAGRLAALALDTALGSEERPLGEAALRATARAIADAPTQDELLEAAAALELRLGRPHDAEARLRARQSTLSPRGASLLSEALRARSAFEDAKVMLEDALARFPNDPLMETELGLVEEAMGNERASLDRWRGILDRVGPFPPAFACLAGRAQRTRDAALASSLVDLALSHPGVAPTTLRHALGLGNALEPEGIHRATRLARLGRLLTERVPEDVVAHLMTARELSQTGDNEGALFHLDRIEELAPASALSADAQRRRFAIEMPEVAAEIDALLRAAHEASSADVATIALRAHKFCMLHENLWTPHFAMGVAEMRGKRLRSAVRALKTAVRIAPGALPAWMHLSRAYTELQEHAAAVDAAERGVALGVDITLAQARLAEALLAAGDRDGAQTWVARALELEPQNESLKALAERVREEPRGGPRAWAAWLRARLRR
jgi:tetratricopeptide (TPR) repeat protein